MKALDFLPHLHSMQLAYDYVKAKQNDGKIWYRSRTDEVLKIETETQIRLVVVGTEPKLKDWLWNFSVFSLEWLNMGRVHSGFAHNVHEIVGREDQPDSLITILLENKHKDLILEGHSRGHPISVLIATLLISHGFPKEKIKVIGCAGARVGCKRFAATYRALMHDRTFVLNDNTDIVPRLPAWAHQNGQITTLNNSAWYRPIHGVRSYIARLTA